MGTRPGARLTVGRTGRIGLTAGLALLPASAAACAVCVEWGREWQGLNPGFYWSAILLTALPFVLVAVAGVWLRRLASVAARPRADSRAPGEQPPIGRRVPPARPALGGTAHE